MHCLYHDFQIVCLESNYLVVNIFKNFVSKVPTKWNFIKKECGTWKDKFRFVFGELNLKQMHLPQKTTKSLFRHSSRTPKDFVRLKQD
jgi:hypothetical protein